ncbi:hypothetical protein F2Q70_00013863 [Brassica cretica]|uniref:RNase III domain-containing protein n=1 Tax=Brassica cretica TaxID=69181 RepID=A0A8S9M6X4_BRACR|nr:hypothetical protein F2Q70_00013863 [Brassica cretica]
MAIVSVISSSLVGAALDTTKPKLRYNPNAPRNVKRNPNSTTSFVPPSSPAATVLTTTSVSVSDLLKRPASKGDDEDSCVGYEKWFPSPPKVKKPRSVFNAASLAYIGDFIYEIYARRHFLFPPLSIEEYNDRVRAVVRCEAQRRPPKPSPSITTTTRCCQRATEMSCRENDVEEEGWFQDEGEDKPRRLALEFVGDDGGGPGSTVKT